MDIDYKRLAQENKALFVWKQKIHSIMLKEEMHDVRAKYNLGYTRNFFYYVKFFKNNYHVAKKYLGAKFAKQYDSLFYAEQVEDALIRQYIPAVYAEMGKRVKNPAIWEELFQYLLLGLRESVWRYSREDIKFITFAINGIRNNIKFFMADKNKVGRRLKNQQVTFSDFARNQENKFGCNFEDYIEGDHDFSKKTEIMDMVRFVADNSNLTDLQRNVVDEYLKTGIITTDVLHAARKKMVKFVRKNPDQFAELACV